MLTVLYFVAVLTHMPQFDFNIQFSNALARDISRTWLQAKFVAFQQ